MSVAYKLIMFICLGCLLSLDCLAQSFFKGPGSRQGNLEFSLKVEETLLRLDAKVPALLKKLIPAGVGVIVEPIPNPSEDYDQKDILRSIQGAGERIHIVFPSRDKARQLVADRNFWSAFELKLLEEFATLVDAKNLSMPRSSKVQERRQRCSLAWQVYATNDYCRQLIIGSRTTFSQDPEFLRRIGNPTPSVARDRIKKSFASYLLHSQSICYHQSLNRYFDAFFNFYSEELQRCHSQMKIPQWGLVGDSLRKASHFDLNPQRVFSIRYLLAEKGTGIDEGWGHSMFQIVGCSPARATPSKECIDDLDYHFVVSFSALIPGEPEIWKGLSGKYVSKLNLQSLGFFLQKYPLVENRSLTSIPLRLTPAEKNEFLENIFDYFYNYAGNYYFLTRNCATEASHFLQLVLDRPFQEIPKKTEVFITPENLWATLTSSGIALPLPLDYRNHNREFFFSSHQILFSHTMKEAEARLPNIINSQSVDEWRHLSSEARHHRFLGLTRNIDLASLRLLAVVFLGIEEVQKNKLGIQLQELLNLRLVQKDPYFMKGTTQDRGRDQSEDREKELHSLNQLEKVFQEEISATENSPEGRALRLSQKYWNAYLKIL